MSLRLTALPLIAAVAFAGALAAAGPAMAQDDDGAQAQPELVGTPYLVRESPRVVRVYFRLGEDPPRRFDGAIRAGVAINGQNSSIGAVRGRHGRSRHCFTGSTRFLGSNPAPRIGRSYRIRVFLRDGGSVTRSVRLRQSRAGDTAGRPLGC